VDLLLNTRSPFRLWTPPLRSGSFSQTVFSFSARRLLLPIEPAFRCRFFLLRFVFVRDVTIFYASQATVYLPF